MLTRFLARRALAKRVEALTAALERADWPRAEREALAAIDIEVEPIELVGVRYALASARIAQGKLDEAEASAREAIAIARAAPQRSDPPFPQLLEQLAAILDARGDREALEKLLREMVASYERMRDPDRGEQSKALERLALALARSDRREEAAPLFARALTLCEGDRDDEALATLLYNAASFHPRLADAIPLFERARALGGGLLARIEHNLAAAYEEAGRIDDARAAYRRALEAFPSEEARPTWVRLARLEHAAGRFDEAASLYERALEVARAELSDDDPIVARIALWLGDARSHVFR